MTNELLRITLFLDRPGGVNRLYRAQRTRTGASIRKSTPARAWAHEAAYSVANQREGVTLPYRFRAHILVDESGFDVDAPLKELLDACQKGGAIVNDKYCRGVTLDIDETRPPGSVMIELVDTGETMPEKVKRIKKKPVAENSTGD
jgi:Holliday junction resolvase RusA-like endonuclease